MTVFQDFEYEIKSGISKKKNQVPPSSYVILHRYQGCAQKVTVPSEIEGIPVFVLHQSFQMNGEIEEIILPNTLQKISNGCFMGCGRLKKIHFPVSLKSIGEAAFENCSSLEEVTFEQSCLKMEELEFEKLVFQNCPKLYDNQGFVLSGSFLLGYYGDATEVTIPATITTILDFAFHNNKKITSVSIPDSVTWIGAAVFQGCQKLENVNLPDGLTVLNNCVFNQCTALERIVLPEKLTYIWFYAFYACSRLKEIQWGSGLKTIYGEAFSDCVALEVIHFPEGLEEISISAFAYCSNLKEIHIPASVLLLREKTFANCDNLEKVVFAPREEWIHQQKNRYSYTSKMRALFFKEGKELSEQVVLGFNASEKRNYRVDQIRQWDLLSEESKDLFRTEWKKKISLKSKIGQKSLRNSVFLDCTAKEMSIYFNEGFHLELFELEHYLQYSIEHSNTAETAILLEYKHKNFDINYLEELKTRKEMLDLGLELPTLEELREKWALRAEEDHITIIGYTGEKSTEILPKTIDNGLPITILSCGHNPVKRSKYSYLDLKKICLPEGIVEIQNNTFSFTYLEEINFPSTLRKIGQKAFFMTKLKEISISHGLTVLEAHTFTQCMDLKKVKLSNSIREIHESAFSVCVNLSEINLPSELEFIGGEAFNCCRSLAEIKFPKNLKKVGKKAFHYCIQLKTVILESDSVEIDPSAFGCCDRLEFVGLEGGENLLPQLKEGQK